MPKPDNLYTRHNFLHFGGCGWELHTVTSKLKKEVEKMKSNTKKVILGAGILVVLFAIVLTMFIVLREKPTDGEKSITIEVVNSAQQSTVYELDTDAQYLRQAMEEADGLTFDGDEGEYGMMVMTVNGETADYNVDQSYWSFYVNGEYCNYGIDTQPVADGDAFKIVYTK